MLLAKIEISKTSAKVTEAAEITAGLVGATVDVVFDDTWEGYTKVYVWSGNNQTKVDTKATGVVPAEVVASPRYQLRFGVYGIKNGEATPTIWASLGMIQPGADPDGDETTDPTLPVWAQLQDQIDDFRETGGATDEQVANAVEKYLEENPVGGGVDFETDATLTLKDGVLSVNTTNEMEQDNTLPITSAGVYTTVGNIEALLKTI